MLHTNSILKSCVWFQTKLHSTQFNYHDYKLQTLHTHMILKQNYRKPRISEAGWDPNQINNILFFSKHCFFPLISKNLKAQNRLEYNLPNHV